MNLREAFQNLLEKYPQAVSESLKDHPIAKFIRDDLSTIIKNQTILKENSRYLVKGSAGQGNWARSPWIAIYDCLITDSVQKQYYIVYAVKEDCSGIFLSLNQGITEIKSCYKVDAKDILKIRAENFLARLGALPNGIEYGEINLASASSNNLSAFYGTGNICSVYYPAKAIPSNEQLEKDLETFINLYFSLVSREERFFERIDVEDDETSLGVEDLIKLRIHKSVERNQKLARQAKDYHGYTCKACGFNFERVYGEIGKEFIEAHHLVPLAKVKGQKISLDYKTDFTVLCSNCHRMIHRTEFIDDVQKFSLHYLRND